MKSFAVDPPYAAASRPSTTSFPVREDCWTEEATSILIDAWGERYIDLNRGNLRQKNWQEVADTVNRRHGHVRNARRTDIQCKNRIDTLKKKYKIEKSRVSDSGDYAGTWQFFHRLDSLIGDYFPAKKPSPPANENNHRNAHSEKLPAWTLAPVGRRSNTQKRPRPAPAPAPEPETSADRADDSSFHRNFSSFAAVVSAVADSENSNGNGKRKRGRGFAEAIEKFGEIYERVEASKQRQIVELEKQRMQFTKDLEIMRMQLFMEMQIELQKNKLSKSKGSSTPRDSFS